jgi:SAM-dependent methyltransferase
MQKAHVTPFRKDDHSNPIGMSTMSPAMADMNAYPEYLLNQVRAFLGMTVWEIGVGNGQSTRSLLAQGHSVWATDIAQECLDALSASISTESQGLLARLHLLQIDLNRPETFHPLIDAGIDSVLCFNVLEHIHDDVAALQGIRRVLPQSANLSLIVPAHPQLFGRMDSEAGHFRRYSLPSLKAALTGAGWIVERCRYVNALGALGWWYHNRVRKSAGLADPHVNHQMRSADRWLPRIARWTDPCMKGLLGLSLVALARPDRSQDSVQFQSSNDSK